jgi:hypothetical protein
MEKFVTTLIVTCTSIAHTKLEAEAEEAASKFVLPPSYRHSGSISEKHACIATPAHRGHLPARFDGCRRRLHAGLWSILIKRMRIETRSRAVRQATAAVLGGMPKSARQVVEEFVFVIRASTSYSIGLGGLNPGSAMLAPLYTDLTFKAYSPQVLVTLLSSIL